LSRDTGRVRRALAIAALAVALAGPASANAADCVTYPGDDAPKSTLAAWMAYGANARGVPGELPVMAALVESNMTNLAAGDSDTAGYFQMRTSIWNRGVYAGYPTNPQLQLNWFVDTALQVLASRRASDPSFGADETRYGEWVADVERPAQQYRYRYQLRLGDARALIGAGCIADGAPAPPPPPSETTDATPPDLNLARARPLRRLKGLAVGVECPGEGCTVAVSARIALPGAARVYRLSSGPEPLAVGQRATVSLRFGRRLRTALAKRRALGRRTRAQVSVRASDAAGNSSVERRSVRLF
jgi:hypothetical protein